MTTQKRILVIGATGAMGQYLVPLLAKQGHHVDAVSLDDVSDSIPNVTYIKANAKDRSVYAELLGRHYDGVVDFLIFNTSELPFYLPTALQNTGHYIYLASYRVYDNKEVPIRETSPRCFETADDLWFRYSDDYSIYKARGEEMLKGSGYTNWTSIRPAITYSRMRYQLVTLEAPLTVGRAFRNKACILPEEARNVQGTLSWAGNAAQMIAGLLFNDKALRECFTISTSEHHTWGEIADYYHDICGLRSYWVPKEDYLSVWHPDPTTTTPAGSSTTTDSSPASSTTPRSSASPDSDRRTSCHSMTASSTKSHAAPRTSPSPNPRAWTTTSPPMASNDLIHTTT